jgi:hypothetical protein
VGGQRATSARRTRAAKRQQAAGHTGHGRATTGTARERAAQQRGRERREPAYSPFGRRVEKLQTIGRALLDGQPQCRD